MYREIKAEITVAAKIDEVWQAWTTDDGAQTFFAPKSNILADSGGSYELFFDLKAKKGEQGAENMKILAIQPKKMLSFTWNNPPHLASIRNQLTHVTVWFEKMDDSTTKVILHHDGWGSGEIWDQAFDYFTRAWQYIVLARLRYRFKKGPIDWDNPPKLANR